MNLYHQVIIILLPNLIDCNMDFTETENQVTLSLGEYFQISFCIFLNDNRQEGPPVSLNVSYPSKNNVLTGVMTSQQITDYLGNKALSVKYGGLTMIVVRMSDESMANLALLSRRANFNSAIWIVFSDKTYSPGLYQKIYIPFDCEFVHVNPRDSLFFMAEIYQIEENGPIETYTFGYWSEDKGLHAPSLYFYSRRNSLKGKTFKAVIVDNPPYTYFQTFNGQTIFGGYSFEVWKELEFRINFKGENGYIYKYKEARIYFSPSEAHKGAKPTLAPNKKGPFTFDNLSFTRTEYPAEYINKDPAQVLQNEDVPFAVAPITQDPTTIDKMDLSEPIYEAKVYLFGHRPGSELEWNSYLKPFSTNTWYVNLGWMLCSSVALTILYRIAWKFGTAERDAQYYVFTFSESFATVFRAMCMQGSDVTPKSNACRLLFLSIYLTALVVTSAFSAALFSLLTIPIPKAPFNTFQEVLTTRGYRMGILPDSDIHKGLQDLATRFPNSIHYSLMNKLLEPREKLPSSLMEGLERVCKNKMYIFMWDLPNVLFTMQNLSRNCQDTIMPSGPMVLREHIGFGMKQGNPYKKLIDLHLIRMKNEGILKRLLLNYWPPRIPTVSTSWVKVTLSDISPILYMFGLGAILGIVMLVLEKAKKHLWKSDIKVNDNPLKQSQFWSNVKHIRGIIQSPLGMKWGEQNGKYTDWNHREDNGWPETEFWDGKYDSSHKEVWNK